MSDAIRPLCVMACLDGETVRTVQAIKAQLCTQGLACDLVPPHITLGVYEGLDANDLLAWSAGFARARAPVPVRFTHLGILAGRVLFVAPRVDEALLGLHAAFHQQFDAFGGTAGAYYSLAGGHWLPHLTLFIGEVADIQRALPTAVQAFVPFSGRIGGLMVGRFAPEADAFGPGDEIAEYPLLGAAPG